MHMTPDTETETETGIDSTRVPAGGTSLLFVCLGNICRSPLAEGVFLHLVRESGLESRYLADSAGTGHWHVGNDPDPRSVEVAHRHGIHLVGKARQVREEDFGRFDLIVAMDRDNLRNLSRIKPRDSGSSELILLREFDPEATGDLDVPDPYYGGDDGFQRVFEMVHRSCRTLLDSFEADRKR
jgi:protein-tyrosine phosphatase